MLLEEDLIICSRCKGEFPSHFFWKDKRKACNKLRAYVCRGCLQDSKDLQKSLNQWANKAWNTIYRHSKKYKSMGLCSSRDDFVERFGWEPELVAERLERAYSGKCQYCNKPYKDMRNGLRDITVDIIDPKKPPDFRINVVFCCTTCNEEKARTAPDEWAKRCHGWRLYEKRKKELDADPYLGTLFETKKK